MRKQILFVVIILAAIAAGVFVGRSWTFPVIIRA